VSSVASKSLCDAAETSSRYAWVCHGGFECAQLRVGVISIFLPLVSLQA
jgi:hypothetical protein